MARKYNIEEMKTELVMTALPAALRSIEDQYVSFLSILELKISLTSAEERVSPKGEPSSFETSRLKPTAKVGCASRQVWGGPSGASSKHHSCAH
jgi:hypothetical protein